MTRHRIDITSDGPRGRVLIDGLDISRAVAGLDLTMNPGNLPRLRLELHVLDLGTMSSHADVVIPDATAEALVALGWTPPAEKTER